jgi:hypothetical protein
VESKLPPKVPVVVKVAMSAYQHTVYSWIKASGGSKAGAAIAAVAASGGAAVWGLVGWSAWVGGLSAGWDKGEGLVSVLVVARVAFCVWRGQ